MTNEEDELDNKILSTLKIERGTKLRKIAHFLRLNESTLRYRLLTLELARKVKVARQRGSVTYFLVNEPERSTKISQQ